MIFEIFVATGIYIARFFIGLLPVGGFPDGVYTALQNLGSYLYVWNPVFPVDTFVTIMGIVVSIELLLLSVRVVIWALRFVPFFGSRMNAGI